MGDSKIYFKVYQRGKCVAQVSLENYAEQVVKTVYESMGRSDVVRRIESGSLRMKFWFEDDLIKEETNE